MTEAERELIIETVQQLYGSTLQAGFQGIAVLLTVAILVGLVVAMLVTYLVIRMVRNTGQDQQSSNTTIESLAVTLGTSISTQTSIQQQALEVQMRMEKAITEELPERLAMLIRPPLQDVKGALAALLGSIGDLETKLDATGQAIEQQVRSIISEIDAETGRQLVTAIGEYHGAVLSSQSEIGVKLDAIIELLTERKETEDEDNRESDNRTSGAVDGADDGDSARRAAGRSRTTVRGHDYISDPRIKRVAGGAVPVESGNRRAEGEPAAGDGRGDYEADGDDVRASDGVPGDASPEDTDPAG